MQLTICAFCDSFACLMLKDTFNICLISSTNWRVRLSVMVPRQALDMFCSDTLIRVNIIQSCEESTTPPLSISRRRARAVSLPASSGLVPCSDVESTP